MKQPQTPESSRRNFASICALLVTASTQASADDGRTGWRDLNHNGRVDPYEDLRLPVAKRADDLLRRMTIEEKAGLLVHGTLPPRDESLREYDLAVVERLIKDGKVNSFITRISSPAADFAGANNAVQRIAEGSRLGIPVTISTDPRNHFQVVSGASTASLGFSQWPETLGLAAIGDPALVRRFARIAAAEYRAVGIHMALSPQADLATEPRWPRGTATFGSDPATVSKLAGAYVEGFQGAPDGLAPGGVATVVKHWVGYGPQPEGFDGHNYYGRVARLDDSSFALHVAAFDGALNAGASGVMPTYPIIGGVTLEGQALEPVGAGFSKLLLNGLLRQDKGFKGVILSDWAITNDCNARCTQPTAEAPQRPMDIAMPWGVESLSRDDRFAKGINAGIDQFGGVNDPGPLVAAIRGRKVAMARIDNAARRVLLQKFALGLFDNPYVDPAAAAQIVGNPASQAEANAAQRSAQVVLENRNHVLPLPSGKRVWLSGIDAKAARAAGMIVVDGPELADVAIVRTATPSQKLHPDHFFGSRQNEGRLDFRDGDPGYDAVKRGSTKVPTIVAVDMDRPAILTNIRDKAGAILAVFGASDAAVLDVITGKAVARGRLPFELPSSMTAVEGQDPAMPDDSANALYPRGAGIELEKEELP